METIPGHTVFVLKKDALERGLANSIIRDISDHFEIVERKDFVLSAGQVARLKEYEWRNNWIPYPSETTKGYSFAYEAGKVHAILCRSKGGENAFVLGKKLKGEHFLAHRCSSGTLRGKYSDPSLPGRIEKDENEVWYLLDGEWKRVSGVPNVVHCVDNEIEFAEHMEVFFPNFAWGNY